MAKHLPPADPRSSLHKFSPSEIRVRHGWPKTLLTTSTTKITRTRHLTRTFPAVLYLTPGTTCPHSTPGCRASCLGHCSGKMRMPQSTTARDKRTAAFLLDREEFIDHLIHEIKIHSIRAQAADLLPIVRLNGTSDILWESIAPQIFELPGIHFYDYTKHPRRNPPPNYHLLYSLNEHPQSEKHALRWLENDGSVAVVFHNMPEYYAIGGKSWPVINGTSHDFRCYHEKGVIVGLKPIGIARTDQTGFVREEHPELICPIATTSSTATTA